ncbi:sigma-70 family RNA polymerase sigma factor [Amycolatopsis sp. 195334CR]|nr:sigma-70 family RNA polymerase sigma factor [Amycolatopsis sp. 195334CR]
MVLGECASRLREPHSARDAAAQTFLIAFQSLGQVRESLAGWLRTVAKNICLKELERQRRITASPEFEGEDEPGAYEQGSKARRAQVDRLLDAVVATMTERQQNLFHLSFREGLRGTALGERLGVSPAQASRLSSELVPLLNDGFGALILAQEGRPHCARLAQILDEADWSGENFTKQLRERIARHFNNCEICDDCTTCQHQRRRLTGTYAPVLIPILIAPEVRDLVENLAIAPAAHASEPADRPPPGRSSRPRPRARRALQATAALAVIALITLVVVLTRPNAPAPVAAPPTTTFRPIAFTTLSGAQLLRAPDAEPETLIPDDPFYVAGDVVFSSDGNQAAWWINHAESGDVVLRDLRTGTQHSWPCTGCESAFLGTELIGTSKTDTGLVSYPADGGPPTPLIISGLPTRPADTVDESPHLTMLTARAESGTTVYAITREGDVSGELRYTVHRINEDRTATAVLDTADSITALALSPDGSRLAHIARHHEPPTYAETQVLTLIDTRTGTTLARTALEPSWAIGDLTIAPDGTATAVAIAQPSPGQEPSSTASARTYRSSDRSWTFEDNARPFLTDVGGGWQTSLTYTATTTNSTIAAGTLTLSNGTTTRTVAENVTRLHPS